MTERTIFTEALGRDGPAERRAYLDAACSGDAALLRRVEALLRSHEEAGEFLGMPVPERFAARDRLGNAPATADADAATNPVPPRAGGIVAGRYKLVEVIGEGGMGTVWLVEQTEPIRRRAALKLIKPGMDSRAVLARFEAERQALALMEHPNIAKVLDAGESGDGRPFFVMELVKGVPITNHCDGERLAPRERLEVFLGVCRAVQHAHTKGVIHRDLKPSNVLVAPSDGGPVVKVIDFGVAKAAGRPFTEATACTGVGAVIGTLEYMSPEQAELDNPDVDTRSDIYSLGVLLYELLAGSPPFTREGLAGAGLLETLRVIRESEPTRPSTRLSTAESLPALAANRRTDPRRLTALVRGELDWIVMKCLEKDRDRRYETANGLARDIERYLGDEPVRACPPSVGYRVRKFVRRNKGPVLAATLVFLALVGGIVGTTWGMIREAHAETDAIAAAEQKERERDKAVRAEREGRHRLFRAKLAEARASRRSREPGQRFETWAALTEAARLARELDLDDDARHALRDEAIACLALTDVRRVKEWPAFPPGSLGTAGFDANLERYARSDATGNISVHDVSDDRQVARLAAPGPFRVGIGGDAIRFSPGGDLLAVRYHERIPGQTTNFLLWDWRRERIAFRPSFDVNWYALGFSPDGRHLALGRQDGTITLHEVGTGNETHRYNAKPDPRHLAFSPDGGRLAVCSHGDVQVWDVAGEKLLRHATPPGEGQSGGLAPRRRILLGAGCGDSNVYLWDTVTAHQHVVLRGHQGGGVSLTYLPGGDTLATTAYDGTSRMWDVWSGRELVRFPGRAQHHLSRDGRRLVTHNGWNLSVWEVDESREFRALPRSRGHGGEEIDHGSFSPDGRWLAVGTSKGLRLWDVATGKEAALLPTASQVKGVQFHPTGTRLFTGGPGGLYDWPVRRDEGVLQIGPPRKLPVGGEVHQISLDREGRILAASGWGTRGGWILDLGALPDNVRHVGHAHVMSAGVSPDGKWVATGTHTGFGVKLWEARTGRFLDHLIPDERSAKVAFSPGGRWLVASTDSAVAVWETGAWQLRRRIPTDQISTCVFRNDGECLAVARSPSLVQLFDPATGRSLARLQAPDTGLGLPIAFSPDNTRLVVSTQAGAGAVRVWELRRIRERLKEIDLDWDWPAYPPAPPPDSTRPVRVEVDLGDLKRVTP